MKKKFVFGFNVALAVVSILGFTTILINALSGVDIGVWIDGLLFVIIGTALVIAGGIKMFIKYFDNGLTNTEISKILTIIVGFFSIVIGIIVLPLTFLDELRVPQLDGVKAVISSLAIIIIIFETWIKKR